MIAVDTSSFSNFLKNERTSDAELVRQALTNEVLVLPPVVVAELFSSPAMSSALKSDIQDIPMLELKSRFWERVGINRQAILQAGKKHCWPMP